MNTSNFSDFKIIRVAGNIGLRFLLVFLAAQALLFAPAGFAEPNQLNAKSLQPQRELVEALRTRSGELQMENSVGQADIKDIAAASEIYYRELENLRVLEARIHNKGVSERALLKIRSDVRTEALSYFEELHRDAQMRVDVAEISKSDLTAIKAAMLHARIKLETIKGTGGR